MSSASNSASSQQASSQPVAKKSNAINEPTTTVNPRERPKANLNAINNIIPLANNPTNICNKTPIKHQAASQAQSKLSVSIRPPVPQNASQFDSNSNVPNEQQTLGFDDDFAQTVPISTITSVSPNQIDSLAENAFQQHSQQPIIQSSSQSSLGDKKSHRRSASHSSSVFLQQNVLQQPANQTPQQILINNQNAYLTQNSPVRLNSPQSQYQMNQYQMLQQQQQTNSLSINKNLLKNVSQQHSRSVSVSPK